MAAYPPFYHPGIEETLTVLFHPLIRVFGIVIIITCFVNFYVSLLWFPKKASMLNDKAPSDDIEKVKMHLNFLLFSPIRVFILCKMQ